MASPASAQANLWNRVQAKPRRPVLARGRCRYAAEFHVLGPVTLTLMAAATTSIRVGTLVTSLYFRHPVTFTKAAMTVDHLSGGRVELALGVRDPSAGAEAAGVDWPAGKRVARFREFVERGRPADAAGGHQLPRPVLPVRGGGDGPAAGTAAASTGHDRRACPKMLGIAAEHGDGWSSWGGYGVETEEDFYVVTSERTHRFDDLCVAAGRDPATAVVP